MLGSAVGRTSHWRRVDDYVLLREEQPAGTEAGSFSGGTWTTRALNTIKDDDAKLVSRISAGVFTLAPGRYRCRAVLGILNPDGCRSRIIDNRSGALIVSGHTTYSGGDRVTTVQLHIEDSFDVTSETDIAYQFQAGSGNGNSWGQGASGHARHGGGEIEVYSIMELWRVAA